MMSPLPNDRSGEPVSTSSLLKEQVSRLHAGKDYILCSVAAYRIVTNNFPWEADVLPLHHSRENLRYSRSVFREIRHCN
jgi:hypothetical protein